MHLDHYLLKEGLLVIIPCVSRLEVTNARIFETAVSNVLNQLKATGVVFDLHQVAFIDSAGIKALLALRRCLPGHERKVYLVRLVPAVKMVLQMVNLGQFFEIDATIEEFAARQNKK